MNSKLKIPHRDRESKSKYRCTRLLHKLLISGDKIIHKKTSAIKAPMANLTSREIKTYLDSPDECPFCHSTDLSGYSVQIESRMAYQTIDCPDCCASWVNTHTLTGIHSIQNGRK